jgi:hypothetical protein
MKAHAKKMAAPIAVAVILGVYYAAIAGLVLASLVPAIVKALAVVVPAGAVVLVIHAAIERAREIKGGEEDDISQY